MSISERKRKEMILEIPQLAQFEDFELSRIATYNDLYWEKFHFQCPILHCPSFQAESAPTPLLLSILLIGASYTPTSEDFKTAIAAPLRWIIFKSSSFHPPTRVWVLQSLLLLEMYEKTRSSSRLIHERAHIHHGTTLQLIRRGSTLLDPSIKLDPENSSTWVEWVEAESIKRAVFLAFVLDVCHSVLFSHGQLLHPNELQLSLPCDDRVWDSAEDNRDRLNAPTISFISGLRGLLKGQHMNLGSELGRLALLYGLLSHFIQISNLDLEASTLDAEIIIPFREKWGLAIGKALNFWWKDYNSEDRAASENILEQQLNKMDYLQHFHYAFISMTTRRYELHVFCGDRRILGKTTIRQDYLHAERYMNEWAKTSVAREAAFHALKGLISAFLENGKPTMYSVTTDPFVHRPMIIAHCALVFWAYAYCLDGPESNVLAHNFNGSHLEDHEWALVAESGLVFLERCSTVSSPRDLDHLKNKNRTVGLLKWVMLALRGSDWPLLVEICQMMDNCVKRSLGWEGAVGNDLECRNIQVG
ncbi:hypothetical protein AWJ20_3547 [Sugiyamaella lignohabitans]|uniref:Xylanolytic transcriptional activator regulatory domain-containing protein n=1 Tax=Sugiyamaella lignohabitans TaxID=796027 RepID=A0A167FZH1_9ASCO|nr:uncharacterized protein AWJ20_3547 [Sugiyamaella lignohabitans]ANB15903.1 hypothetical protein AWJ20_3547 [Sugiyamaella lignohabitans]